MGDHDRSFLFKDRVLRQYPLKHAISLHLQPLNRKDKGSSRINVTQEVSARVIIINEQGIVPGKKTM